MWAEGAEEKGQMGVGGKRTACSVLGRKRVTLGLNVEKGTNRSKMETGFLLGLPVWPYSSHFLSLFLPHSPQL
jgi:hypothetical protein